MTILAATDLSDNSEPAIRYAHMLARSLDEQLVVVSVVELWERDMGEVLQTFEDVDLKPSAEATAALRDFVESALADAADVEARVLVGHPPMERILAAASDVDASLIVAGTSGQSRLTESFFGSTISALARRSIRPVLAVPPDTEPEPIETILAPVDLSECSERSLRYAGEFAERIGARLIVQHSAPFGTPTVAPPIAYVPESATQIRKAAKSRVEAMVSEAGLSDTANVLVELGPPHGGILRSVEEESVDLIIMGTHGRTGMAKFFLGSTAERVLRDRPCPVLIIRDFEGK